MTKIERDVFQKSAQTLRKDFGVKSSCENETHVQLNSKS